ncbi:ribonuclease H1 domain-containing protein [Clostridium perfringens]|uniref:ribonuclease H1 domain-containing protein n=1 Tax=Clostridium perfringens TaxID=1502 RepID=UPI00115E0340|nr:ribonuclease H family protein [Clostridium perfringens]MBO3429636.1 ribonuclease H family protein [Clostridium perfringens]MDG6890884.1 Ribonuclease H [Clostridium perfringens]MDM0854233.1 ribonuclease H family protein [Clostridium perfringens]
MKYYVVKNGKKPGIYKEWKDCEKQVKGFPNAIFKSFKNLEEAEEYYGISKKKLNKIAIEELNDDEAIIYVDGSYDNNIKRYGYGAIIFNKNMKKVIQGNGEEKDLIELRNVAGELKAAINSIKYSIDNGIKKIYLHYDYIGIENWFTGEWKANTEFTKAYVSFANKVKDLIEVNFIKVKAHSGDKYNEEVDLIAKNSVKNNLIEERNDKKSNKYKNSIINKKGITPIFNIDMGNGIIVESDLLMDKFKKEWRKSKRKLTEIEDLTIVIDVLNEEASFSIKTDKENIKKIIAL